MSATRRFSKKPAPRSRACYPVLRSAVTWWVPPDAASSKRPTRSGPYAFPQHGKGKKHERPIELTDWQLKITHEYPRELIRGLIHSDGCRTINRFCVDLPVGGRRQYEYVRYFFSNLSADIRGIFVAHCELLGIRCTQSNHRNISVSHRDSVALLESFVGPKR